MRELHLAPTKELIRRSIRLELQIMNVLRPDPQNVQTVPARMKGRNLAYTTVQTMLHVLHRKGWVTRRLKDRTYVYRPVLSRQKASRSPLATYWHFSAQLTLTDPLCDMRGQIMSWQPPPPPPPSRPRRLRISNNKVTAFCSVSDHGRNRFM